jgi:hypothetical protein
MVGRIDACFLLSYAIDPEQAAARVPAGLELITWRGAAFLNIVVCHVDRMRPRQAPRALGVTHWYVAYRLHVLATTVTAGSIEGLYFLRSDIDRPFFGALGNALTDFCFHPARITSTAEGDSTWRIRVEGMTSDARASLVVSRGAGDALVPGSPFASVEEREKILKYSRFGLSVSRSGRCLRVAEVIRDEALWSEQPIRVDVAEWNYPGSVDLGETRLVRATRVAPIDYRWRLGRTERI